MEPPSRSVRPVGDYYHASPWPVEGVVDDVFVVHGPGEQTALRESGNHPSWRGSVHHFINGIYAATRARPPHRHFISSIHAPAYSAMKIKHWAHSMDRDMRDAGFAADHTFVPRQPQPGDGGDDFVRQAYARCQGCYARGYHLPETELRCFAFGVPEPPKPPPGQSTPGGGATASTVAASDTPVLEVEDPAASPPSVGEETSATTSATTPSKPAA